MKSRKIYNRIDVLRKDLEISRKELANKIVINYQTLGYLEREEYNPSLDMAFRISEVFQLPLEFIFSTRALPPLNRELLQKIKLSLFQMRKTNIEQRVSKRLIT